MKKPITSLFCLLLCLLMLLTAGACSEHEAQGETDSASAPASTAEQDLPQQTEKTAYAGSHAYDPETDFDRRLNTSGNGSTVIEMDDFYYWLPDDDGYLRYCEKDGSDYGVVCAKPDCVHDNGNPIAYHREKNCNGYVGSAMRYMWMAEGKLYFVNDYEYLKDRSYCAAIVRMDPDGTNKEVVNNIPKPQTPYGEGLSPQNFCYHRGMLYSFVCGGSIDNGEPSQPFLAMAFPVDGDEWITIYDAGSEFHWGSVMPVGDYCYIVDNAWNYADPSILEDDYYDGEVVLSRSERILLRWCSVTGETEELYRGDTVGLHRYWIDDDGSFYTQDTGTEEKGSNTVLRLNGGEWEEIFDFDDPDMDYNIISFSDGIVIARNYVPYDRDYYIKYGADPDIDIWIKRYDGTTVYKGKLPMAWLETMEETPLLDGASLICGDENELLCVFNAEKRTPDRSNEPQSYVLVKYVITDGEIEEIFLGKTYHAIIGDWNW